MLAAVSGPAPVLALREDTPFPPPVWEVLAEYSTRVVDPAAARRGAARARAGLAMARTTAAERRARRTAAQAGLLPAAERFHADAMT